MEEIEKLKKKYNIVKEISFDEFNLKEKIKEQLQLEIKYYDLLKIFEFELEELEESLIELECDLFDKFKFENEKVLTKTEIEKFYIPKNEKVKEIKKEIRKKKKIVNFFTICYTASKNLKWNINSYLKERNS